MFTTVYVKGADRMITAARLVPEGVYVRFADEREGTIPLADLALTRAPRRVTVPRPHALRIHLSHGAAVELPWDFARHYADREYRAASESAAANGRALLAERVRALRAERGMTQDTLAATAGISRVSVTRIETGDQLPRYRTLLALAQALAVPIHRLLLE